MAPYSLDLRERVAAAVDHKEGSLREIARRFRVSLSFVVRLLQRRRRASTLAPKPHGGGPKPALNPRDQERLRRLVQENNDATLKQLKQRGGFECTLATIWNTLRRLGLTYKKKTLRAAERNRPDVRRKRGRFRKKVARIEPKRLVFVDETGINTAMTPTYGWAPRGERAVGSVPTSWETITVIAALGLDGVRAPLAFAGATNAAVFHTYVELVLRPELRPGDVVVFDNLSAHLAAGVTATIKRAGAEVLRLPPYSSDYTPIEEMWSKAKQYIRRAGAQSRTALYDALGDALRHVTAPDILGWFRHAGLCATQS
jgi:transposase